MVTNMRPIDFKGRNWFKVSEAIRKRDNYRCYACGGSESLSVHHIKPRREGGKSIPRNLVTLCNSCHNKAEEAENTWLWIQLHKYRREKTPIKFNVNNRPDVPLEMGQHLSFDKSIGKWRIWGRDKLGIYSIEIDPSWDSRVMEAGVPYGLEA